jgi:hypothetical protein
VRLVLDWDGTVTERDTLELVIFGDIGTYRRTGAFIGHRLSHDEALARSFTTILFRPGAACERRLARQAAVG